MPRFVTRMTNSDFDRTDEGVEHDSLSEASKAAIRSASRLAADLVAAGDRLAHVEVVISGSEGPAAKHLVTLSVADEDIEDPD